MAAHPPSGSPLLLLSTAGDSTVPALAMGMAFCTLRVVQKKKKEELSACRGLGRVVGSLLAARALPLRCAASTVLSSTLLAI
jgi:hypothetical protein